MFAKLKLLGYGVLTILAIWFAIGFYVNYSAVTMTVPKNDDNDLVAVPRVDGGQTDTSTTNQTANPETNAAPDAVTTADASTTNAEAIATGDATNADGTASIQPATTNSNHASATAKKQVKKKSRVVVSSKENARAAAAETRSAMMKYLGALVMAMVGLGLLIAYDATRYFANRGIDALFDDDGTAGKDPEYERAEQLWANGHPIEAIEAMREHLKKNPREQFVALRIAEIYEKDLKNLLAASMEIEEVLKHKLRPDRWGWTAIHLCNIYSKMGKQKEYNALLNRIVTEYPKTSAAIKARKVLGLPEEGEEPTPTPSMPAGSAPAPKAIAPEVPDENAPKSNLPPGFRPK